MIYNNKIFKFPKFNNQKWIKIWFATPKTTKPLPQIILYCLNFLPHLKLTHSLSPSLSLLSLPISLSCCLPLAGVITPLPQSHPPPSLSRSLCLSLRSLATRFFRCAGVTLKTSLSQPNSLTKPLGTIPLGSPHLSPHLTAITFLGHFRWPFYLICCAGSMTWYPEDPLPFPLFFVFVPLVLLAFFLSHALRPSFILIRNFWERNKNMG
jgi:hypothetical protein